LLNILSDVVFAFFGTGADILQNFSGFFEYSAGIWVRLIEEQEIWMT
jgi:hypothetical protein